MITTFKSVLLMLVGAFVVIQLTGCIFARREHRDDRRPEHHDHGPEHADLDIRVH